MISALYRAYGQSEDLPIGQGQKRRARLRQSGLRSQKNGASGVWEGWCDGRCFVTSLISETWSWMSLDHQNEATEEIPTSNGLIVYRTLHHLGRQEPESWINSEGMMGQTFGYFEAEAIMSWIVHYQDVVWSVLACFQVNFLRPFLEGAINGTPLTARWVAQGFNKFRWSHILIN